MKLDTVTESDATQKLAMRPAEVVLDPTDMGGARCTRHSFARSMIRRAIQHGWHVERERFDIDAGGRGAAIYRADAQEHTFRFVVFSRVLDEGERTDRVIAAAWDVTAALVTGEVDDDRLASLSSQVPLQERGRAEAGTLIWTRANRSQRFFNYVVDRLAAGAQPEADAVGASPYVLRSTAFYSNGKFGLIDFEGLDSAHPLAVPYRAHMLAAWLLREFSYDLVEHCAALRSASAVRLAGGWQRYFGLGNATGLGMVPYVINHPQMLNAWARLRELPLATVLSRSIEPSHPDVTRVQALLLRAVSYLEGQRELATAPYLPGPELAHALRLVVEAADEFASRGTISGQQVAMPWTELHRIADEAGPEVRGVVASVLTELTDPIVDEIVESGLRCDEAHPVRSGMTCGELAGLIREHYAWVDSFEFAEPAQQHHFWFSSLNNEEPRRAVRGLDPGEAVQHGVDIARMVVRLRDDLAGLGEGATVAEFLATFPRHRAAVARVQTVGTLEYGEVRSNLLAREFLPLNVQRLQLAVYGMENYSPQSTDWLRVTLFSGAPRVEDLAAGSADDDWIFTLKPGAGDRA